MQKFQECKHGKKYMATKPSSQSYGKIKDMTDEYKKYSL